MKLAPSVSRMSRTALSAGLTALSVVAAAPAFAADYPDHAIRLIVPAPPGDGTDILARSVGKVLGERLGQSVVIENRPGAGGGIAADAVAKAAPDGYTLMMGNASSHAVTPGLYKKLSWDPVKDFTPIALIASAPNVLVVNPNLPVKNIQEFIAYAKANPGKLNIASGGNGSLSHLSAELFNSMAGTQITHVPYKGAAPAVTALMGGEVSALLINIPTVTQHIASGKLRGLAVSGKTRSPQLPDLPTLNEAGLKGYDTEAWFGLFAPARTPAAVITKLQAYTRASLAEPAVQTQMRNMGAVKSDLQGAAFATFMQQDLNKYGAIIKSANVQVD
ncbi:hypothetical protein GCM10007242_12890 [Pigmentiphaga litoralis]|uniref:Bug family tripartite tricarboxylate transporter substrate binding protein n=1 Tax=Pigmentiphaga litoralis TaxID=516702 RepID=UPI00167BE72D|nr:tripartite tricarboxylate transporter substrate binding protein [Pigmentiphaga litoralis]GGX08471.1 hypothetical protein GCM10007242_12890 [Pigmentiphaga litoralis]